MRTRVLTRALSLAGTAGAWRALRTLWYRERAEAPAAQGELRARVPGPVRGAEPRPGGGTVHFARASLEIRVLVGGAVFCGWDGATPLPSYALAGTVPAPDTRTELEPDKDDGWRVVSERVTLVISRLGAVELRTPGGVLLRRDLPPRWWEPVEPPARNGRSARPHAGDGAAPACGHWMQYSQVAPDARVFGLPGDGAPRRLPREGGYRLRASGDGVAGRGKAVTERAVMPVQLVVADAGTHLVFHDNTWEGAVTVSEGAEGAGSAHDRPGRAEVRFDGGPLRYWLLPGPPSRALRLWTVLTGGAAVPPSWALGHQHLLPATSTRQEVERVVAGHLARGLPLRAVHLDGRGGVERRATVRTPVLPELSATADRLSDHGVRLVAAVPSAVPATPGDPAFESGRRVDAFVRDGHGRLVRGPGGGGGSVYPDFTNPLVRSWWGGLYAEPFRQGVAGVWLPAPEPPVWPRSGAPALPRSARHSLEGRGGDRREAGNIRGLTLHRAAYQGLRQLRPDQRPLVLARSGWAGTQRYGGLWVTGTGGGWEGLRAALTRVLELAVCGVPVVGVDVGGDGPRRPSAELYLRWLQLGAYLPLLRTRGAYSPGRGEPWEFEERVEEHARAALAERERLLPYLATLARVARRTGAPWVRPLWWHTPRDRALRDCCDAFLLGDALLVAPVLAPGVERREVRLPRGRWYDTATGTVHRGPGRVVVPAPLGRVPVLARAGAVIPVRGADGETELEVWAPPPGRTGGGLVAEDVGDGWRRGTVERYTVRLVDGEPRVTREDAVAVERRVRVRGRGA